MMLLLLLLFTIVCRGSANNDAVPCPKFNWQLNESRGLGTCSCGDIQRSFSRGSNDHARPVAGSRHGEWET